MGIASFSQQTVNAAIAAPVGSGNFIINGAFDIAQKGNSINYVSPTIYTLDRFWANGFGTGQPFTVSRHTTNPPQNFRYFMRITQTSSNGTNLNIGQPLETDTVIGLRGARVTASFWVRVVNNFTNPWSFNASFSNSLIDSSLAPGVSGGQAIADATIAIANISSWVFYQKSFTIPSDATSFAIAFSSGNSVANGAVIEITGIQLELGSVATPFRRNAPSIQAELAACQRYYVRHSATTSSGWFSPFGSGFSTAQANLVMPLLVTMRTKPSSVEFANLELSDFSTETTITNVLVSVNSNQSSALLVCAVASGLTQFRPYALQATNSSGFIGLSAELL
jgi:hypothetical protein